MTRSLIAILSLATVSSVVPEFVGLGFTHILPDGLDHILFILGLFFLARDVHTLLLQVTLFTMAHSLTLGLAMKRLLAVNTQVVEIAIALSIAFIAAENLMGERLSRWRPWMVFGFGLVHGLGFAHSFGGIPVRSADFMEALFSFNVGIELGQLVVVGLAFALVAAWWRREWYLDMVARPASVSIALAGMYLAVERSL
jgi:hypothetical protein